MLSNAAKIATQKMNILCGKKHTFWFEYLKYVCSCRWAQNWMVIDDPGETAAFNIVLLIDSGKQRFFLWILLSGGPWGEHIWGPIRGYVWGSIGLLVALFYVFGLLCFFVVVVLVVVCVGVGGLILGPYPFMGSGGQFQVLSLDGKYKSTHIQIQLQVQSGNTKQK